MYEYDANGLLSKDFSNPSGAVAIATTPYIGYTYDTMKTGNNFTRRLRPVSMEYPSGKTLTYDYDTYNNVSAIKDGASPVVSYQHSGSGAVVKTTYNEPGLSLDYANGLDRFGRITIMHGKSRQRKLQH